MPFLSEKNISPIQISFWCAIGISFLVAIMLLIFDIGYLKILIAFSFIFFTCLGVFYYALDFFLFRKIKLLYKFISHRKSNLREESIREIVMPKTTIAEVTNDVIMWANDREQQIETLEKNEIFRREFLMNFSHEIKTPIFSVQGYLHTLADGAKNDEQVRDKFIANAIKGIDRLSTMVGSIDEITKLESGAIELNEEKFIIHELIKDVYEELNLEADNKEIKLLIKEGCENDIWVFGDKNKIKQVLINLVQNAIKYSHNNGTIQTGVYVVDSNNVYVEVTDNGIGIVEDHVPRVFERFFRTDNGRSRNIGGSGLGLAIVKHIIEAHGHSVTCRSSIGVGSSFGFGIDKG